MQENNSRATFTTRLGAIATTAGSAVGLGNIWRFPYEAGANGGGAFLICYIGFILLLGIPLLCGEYIIGRDTRSNIFGAFRKLAPGGKWHYAGYIGIVASLMILSFYSVVAGWTMEYCVQSATGCLGYTEAGEYHSRFVEFCTGNWRPLLWTLIFLAVNYAVLSRGVAKGIERISNILMPVLLVLLIGFCINSLTLSKASEGLQFLFRPDFSQLSARMILAAMGQAFFSLSLGLGGMMTYASYFTDDTRLGRCAVTTASLDSAVALLAGIIIFPAVFTFGMSPAAGPTLVFEVLPSIFHQWTGGAVWSTLFFFLLFLASLTSTISMSEISISFFMEEKGMSRKAALGLNTLIAVVFGSICALSFGALSEFTLFGLTVFNLFDYVSSNILLPVGGLIIALFAGWFMDRRILRRQLTNNGNFNAPLMPYITFCLRYIAPACIILVLLNSLGVF